MDRAFSVLTFLIAGGAVVSGFSLRNLFRSSSSKRDPICTHPGDPSLILTTNVVLGEGKKDFMLGATQAIADVLGKPKEFIAVAVNDGVSMMWNENESPCALGTMTSIGGINLENNKALQLKFEELLACHAITGDRIYITYVDVERQNIGWNGKTFAG
jgi:phenylpyruvate tautomerase